MRKVAVLLYAVLSLGFLNKTSAQSFDTTGLKNWTLLLNSYESWQQGAFNLHRDPTDFTDFGWGYYDLATHFIEGDSIYLLKTTEGDYKLLSIDRLVSGTYTLSVGNIDGTGRQTLSLDRDQYSGKNFFYYDLGTGREKDLEPLADQWDLLFTKYPIVFPGFGAYPVVGVLQNYDVEVAKVATDSGVSAQLSDTLTYPFESRINGVGYDWKDAFAGVVYDTLSYFIRDTNQPASIKTLQLNAYGGSASGNIAFTIDGVADSISLGMGNNGQVYYSLNNGAIYTNNDNDWDIAISARRSFEAIPIRINDAHGAELYLFPKSDISAWEGVGLAEQTWHVLEIAPNPIKSRVQLSLHATSASNLQLQVRELSGKLLWEQQAEITAGLNRLSFEPNLKAGTYLISLSGAGFNDQQKIVVRP
jgi:hypothetical protein